MTELVKSDFFSMGTGMEARARIQLLAMILDKMEGKIPIEDFKTVHHFAPKQYGREFHMPAGTVIVGKIHKHSHINVISKGRCIVATYEGEVELVAPATFVSSVGTQRAVYCLEDTVWTTFHSVENVLNKSLTEIEDELIAKDYNDPELPVLIEQAASYNLQERLE